MTRTIIKPEIMNYEEASGLELGLDPKIVPWLTFRGEHHFDHMAFNSWSQRFSNGYFKEGTIRYDSGSILLPVSKKILAFESSEFRRGEPPRGFFRLKQVVVSPLEELTDEEIKKDGFEDREEMIWQMTEMENRYYNDLKPESLVSYFQFGSLCPLSLVRGQLTVHPLKKQNKGRYWKELRQKDQSGWTKYLD